jgi:hypothetical protein
MATRVQVIVSEEERERFRRLAERRGQSLSAWMREAARERAVEQPQTRFETAAQLDDFFGRQDARQAGEGREPDWEEHLAVLEGSIRRGAAGT